MAGVRTITRLEALQRVHRRTGHEIDQARRLGEVRRLAELYTLQHRLEAAITAEGGTVRVASQRQPLPGSKVRAPSAPVRRLAEIGATSRQVKAWAVAQGLLPAVVRGNVRADLVEAYAASHSSATSDPQK